MTSSAYVYEIIGKIVSWEYHTNAKKSDTRKVVCRTERNMANMRSFSMQNTPPEETDACMNAESVKLSLFYLIHINNTRVSNDRHTLTHLYSIPSRK